MIPCEGPARVMGTTLQRRPGGVPLHAVYPANFSIIIWRKPIKYLPLQLTKLK